VIAKENLGDQLVASLSLKSIKLMHYKGFERHSISFRETNVLVGANNAGKSTVLGALRLVAAMLPQARRVRPTTVGELDGMSILGWPITMAALDASAFSMENIRHDFRSKEARVEVVANTGAKLVAVWPPDDDGAARGMYYVIPPPSQGFMPARKVAEELVPSIAIVPTLSPLDDTEAFIQEQTLHRNRTSRRASRYFRNALWRLDKDEWEEFKAFVYNLTPEILDLQIRLADGAKEDAFDLFYTDDGSRHEREIVWAGDGIQIWLQVLYHVWCQKDCPVLVLDEPDVFLHPDLQRRLARTIFSRKQQVILATHSIEILAEADPGSAVWVDRSRSNSERPRSDGALALLGRRLGSGYELGVARALRSSAVLFVEGDDAPVLALLASRLGAKRVSSGEAYATVPLGNFIRNTVAGGFAETMAVLGGAINTFVILDGDLRCPEAIAREVNPLKKAGAKVHIWARREIENYVLQASAISAVTGLSRLAALELLESCLEVQKEEAKLALQTQRIDESKAKIGLGAKHSSRTVLSNSANEFKALWNSHDGRLSVVDAKTTIRCLNTSLQLQRRPTLNVYSLARNLDPADAPQELHTLMEQLEDLVPARSRR
jgi:hypothetical protein